ncbi:MAG: ATP-dependent DNA helicase, partial [Actinomycetes bacterium]
AVDARDGGVHRVGQHDMCGAVAEALAARRHLFVEAPTGTGKSLAYLIPAVARAAIASSESTDDGTARVVVSTATKALQEQLVDVDLPFVQAALEDVAPFSFAMLKGRSNYLCRARLAPYDGSEGQLFEAPDAATQAIVEWAADTATGDRSESGCVDDAAWSHLSVGSDECPGAAACDYGSVCWAERARARAAASDIVVVNSHLYAAHLAAEGNVLPDHDAVIFDEAHELEDIVVGALSVSLTARRISAAAGLARTGGASARVVERLRVVAASFDSVVAPLLGSTVELADGSDVRELVEAIRGVSESAVVSLGSADPAGSQAKAAQQQATASLRSLVADAETALGRAHDSGAATWVDGSEDSPRLCAASIDVAPVLATHLFPEVTVVATSATLTVGGEFTTLLHRLGATRDFGAGTPEFSTLRVASPFDFAKQGILYVAAHLPDPTREREAFEPAARDEVARLALAAGGRTLALFTSWAAARAAAAHLRATSDLNVLCQGDAPRSALVDEFSAVDRAVLVATSSFWTGLDLHGDRCTLVVIDRIPFGRPNDPVVAARERICAEQGGNGFRDVSLPAAALTLAQGVGRLIRSDSDRGVVAVLDRRLRTAPYGRLLLGTLPPLWFTTDPERVAGSLRRLDAAARSVSDASTGAT